MERITLDAGWELRRRDPARSLDADLNDPEGWIAAKVPGSVHEALLAAGAILDPFYGLNEKLERNQDSQERLELRLAQTQARIEKQYTMLDAKLGQLNSLSTYVTQQVAMWSKQGNS